MGASFPIVVVFAATFLAQPPEFGYVPESETTSVEIAPGKFIAITRWDWTVDDRRNKTDREQTRLRIPYGERTLEWTAEDIPFVLREKDGVLYLACYAREEERRTKSDLTPLHYYRQKDSGFEAIAPGTFPKEIATQNMFLGAAAAKILALETSSMDFRLSLNAKLWRHLLTGKLTKWNDSDQAPLDEYMKKYRPQKLTGRQLESNEEAK